MNATAYERLVDVLRDHGSHVNANGTRAVAQCPAHNDGRPSLSITGIDGQVLIHCHAGCPTEAVVEAVNLGMADLFDTRKGADYRYPDGRIVHRKLNKTFPQSGNTKGADLFHADRIGDAATVYIPEGEKDVLAIEALGGAAVCSAMGAGKAHKADWSVLKGKTAVVIADKDKPGRDHATQAAGLLDGVAASVQVVEAAAGKDAADHIAAGHTLDELVPITDGRPRRWKAADLKPAAQPRWLAKNRIPRAAPSLLIGDEGLGKSLLWVWLVAAVSTGAELPGFGIPARAPGRVIIAAITEDDWCSVVRPRLEVAGADLSMIDVICVDDDGSGAPVYPRDMHLISQADPKPDLVIVDAWLDTVPAALSVRDPQQARQALHPWKEIATLTDAAVLLLCHTNRVSTANARDKYGATGELRKKARMTLFAQADDDGNLTVGPEKMNTAAPIPASKFTITTVQHFEPTEDHDGAVPLLTYLGESTQTAREQLADNYAADHSAGAGADDVVAWLATYLAAGPRWAKDTHNAGERAGFSQRKRYAAKKRLSVEATRADGDGPWFWRLPQHADRAPDDQDDAVSVIWSSGSSGDHLENPHNPPTSQDILMINRETRWSSGLPKTTPEQHTAYRNGLCIDGCGRKHSAGRPRCNDCHRLWANIAAGYDQ
ncbi:MAG: AAA family ATPase [Mycobacterium sp.]|nr:AAA family ATPase [Mycobacterium sp.]